MIPRHQSILLTVLVAASLGMGVVLWQLRERAHLKLLAGEDSAPTQAPVAAPAEQATLLVANDTDGALLPQSHILPLPKDPGTRARVILGKLLDIYAAPGATHPVPGGAASISQVYLLPVANIGTHPTFAGPESASAGPQLAVVNLAGSFVATHPSGLETETLTILSICDTLHANLPYVAQVRFLVDGQSRTMLAGHADLSRTCLPADAAGAVHP